MQPTAAGTCKSGGVTVISLPPRSSSSHRAVCHSPVQSTTLLSSSVRSSSGRWTRLALVLPRFVTEIILGLQFTRARVYLLKLS